MNLPPTQLSLPFHDVAKTQRLRERLKANPEAASDLRDILTLGSEEAEAKIQEREDIVTQQAVDEVKPVLPGIVKKGIIGANLASIGFTLAKSPAHVVPVAAVGALATACSIGVDGLLTEMERKKALVTRQSQVNEKKKLLTECENDPLLLNHLKKNPNSLVLPEQMIKKPVAKISKGTKEPSKLGKILGTGFGIANSIARAPQILSTPLANAVSKPKTLIDEYNNERIGLSATLAALGGLSTAALLIASGVESKWAIGAATVVGALAGETGAHAITGSTSPLLIGRETQKQLGKEDPGAWQHFKTGVKLASDTIYSEGFAGGQAVGDAISSLTGKIS